MKQLFKPVEKRYISCFQCKPPREDNQTTKVISTSVGMCIVKWSGQQEAINTWKWSFRWSCCSNESMYQNIISFIHLQPNVHSFNKTFLSFLSFFHAILKILSFHEQSVDLLIWKSLMTSSFFSHIFYVLKIFFIVL